MALIAYVSLTKLSQKWIIFLTNQTFFFVFFVSTIFISLLQQFTWKSKLSKKAKFWMTPHEQAKICTWNCPYWKTHQNQQEWIDACPKATKAINKAKTESWKDLLQEAMTNSDGPNIWKVIQVLNTTPGANSANESISHISHTISNIKSKANVFISHYATVSRLNMLRTDQNLNCQFKKQLNDHLPTMKAVLHFKWISYYLPSI